MEYNDDMLYNVPKNIRNRTKKYMEKYCLNLNDAFKEAVRELAKPGTNLYNAFYNDDFRKFIPSAYIHEYLDFNKYPLRYDHK